MTGPVRFRWYNLDCPGPMIGDIVAAERGRSCYRVLGHDAGRRGVDRHGNPCIHYRLELEQLPRSAMTESSSSILWFSWDRRS